MQWYGVAHSPLAKNAVYGLSEMTRCALRQATLIACPGCYATACELALLPVVADDHLTGSVIIDAKSGVSGAGRRTDRPDLLFAQMANNFKAYAIGGHRHHPEILQAIKRFTGQSPPPIVFTPHLLPTVRGIHANLYMPVKDSRHVLACLKDYWQGNHFIEVLDEGGCVELAEVIFTNRAVLSVHRLSANLVLVSVVLDNLLKGAAGQAVQNMNIRFGIAEVTGLPGPAS